MTSPVVVLGLATVLAQPMSVLRLSDIPAGMVRHVTPLASEVVFVLSSEKFSYVVGEGLRLTFAVRSVAEFPIRASLDLNPHLAATLLYCRRGAGDFVKIPLEDRYREIEGEPIVPLTLGDERRFSLTVSIADRFSPTRRFLLDQPGVYQCRVNYADTGDDPNGLLESNVITFNVTMPTGTDLEALGALSPEMACLEEVKTSCFVSPAAVSLADQFLRDHGASIYASAIRDGLGGHLWPRVITGRATSEERAVWERHFTGDTIKPTLAISPSVATLWPPNKTMTLVGINVTTSDNSGAIPLVKLVSITCDDSCDATKDIADAAFGTDDREFRLRADRTGGGTGRTYTITYAAADAAGNKATATTTVVVPHDQGKTPN